QMFAFGVPLVLPIVAVCAADALATKIKMATAPATSAETTRLMPLIENTLLDGLPVRADWPHIAPAGRSKRGRADLLRSPELAGRPKREPVDSQQQVRQAVAPSTDPHR